MSNSFLFTSESVSEGHPDKVADQISDAVLDAILAQDKYSRVAAETLCNTGLVVMAGEITTKAVVDFQTVARETIRKIGYDNTDYGIDYRGCAVLVAYDKQSPDIAQGVDEGKGLNLEQGAGDQGLMFGYACTETDSLMPLPIYLSHRLVQLQAQLRKSDKLPFVVTDLLRELVSRDPQLLVSLITTVSKSRGTLGCNCRGGTVSDPRTWSNTSSAVRPVKGARPVSRKYKMPPNAYTSVTGPIPAIRPSACSGAI